MAKCRSAGPKTALCLSWPRLLSQTESTASATRPTCAIYGPCSPCSHIWERPPRHDHILQIDTSDIHTLEAPYDLVKTMRASVLVLGPMLARYRRARISLPGGCAIGARPINLHLKALEQMGVDIDLEHGYVVGRAKRLRGALITFDQVTVTGTENIMMAACLADGVTVLKNSAREPEVVALADYLNRMGAQIEGAGTDEITITGVRELTPSSCEVIPDRIEAGTYLVAAAITGGTLTLKGCRPDHLQAIIQKLSDAGLSIESNGGLYRGPPQRQRYAASTLKRIPFRAFRRTCRPSSWRSWPLETGSA